MTLLRRDGYPKAPWNSRKMIRRPSIHSQSAHALVLEESESTTPAAFMHRPNLLSQFGTLRVEAGLEPFALGLRLWAWREMWQLIDARDVLFLAEAATHGQSSSCPSEAIMLHMISNVNWEWDAIESKHANISRRSRWCRVIHASSTSILPWCLFLCNLQISPISLAVTSTGRVEQAVSLAEW